MRIAAALIVIASFGLKAQELYSAKKVLKLMGTRFEITAVATNDTLAWKALNAGVNEITRIEKNISSWDANSQTSSINRAAGIKAVKVDRELFDLIYRAKKVSQLTEGAFDISFASMQKIWVFDGLEHTLPDSQLVAEAASKVNWQNIVLNDKENSVFLKKKGMKIGFGAIGKGYAANKAKSVMSDMEGVKGGVVNASGDLIAWGHNEKSDYWDVQIANPKNKSKSLGWVSLKDQAIVTSGDYEKFFTSNGTRYAHIVNPKTGYPTTGIKSVTIICPDAELADALATSIFVLGKDKGVSLVNQLNEIECIIVDDNDNISSSDNLKMNYYQ